MAGKMSRERIRLKRAYDEPSAGDGKRILVDRLWPRGVKKADAAIELWAKDLAPSAALRKWFGHDPGRWQEFRRRYMAEIEDRDGQFEQLRDLARKGAVTLVYAAHDEAHNNAVVLRELLLADE